MKIVYMGTPDFAATILKVVLAQGADVAAVFTQADKPVGRKQVLTPPPVKVLAQEAGIPVYQPRHIKYPKWVNILKEIQPDLILVAAFGQILSQEILDIPRLGCINFHGSLLPEYRGAAPAQWCLANGETVTGVTAMMMDAGMDTGDMLFARTTPIAADDTAETLLYKLSLTAAGMVPEVLAWAERGTFTRTPQNAAEATYAPIISKEDGAVNWHMSADNIANRLRGFTPWPGIYSFVDGAKIEFLSVRAIRENAPAAPGTVLAEYLGGKHPRLIVCTALGLLEVLTVKPQGKKEMRAEDYLRGADLTGKIFSNE